MPQNDAQDDRHDDARTTLAEVRETIRRFVDERDWNRFHAPKNLAMALSIEVAELMEHFQWLSVEESRTVADDPAKRMAIGEELADVFCYTLALANSLDLDLTAAFVDKMAKNRAKYPVEAIKGRWGHDDPNQGSAAAQDSPLQD